MGRTVVLVVLAVGLVAAGCTDGDSDDATTDTTAATEDPTTTGRLEATTSSTDPTGDDPTADDADTDDSDSAPSTTSDPAGEDDPVAAAGFCQADDRTDHVVRFAPGESATAIDTAAGPDQIDLYRIDVADDQIMTITLRSEDDDAGFGLLTPGDAPLDGPFTELLVEETTAGANWVCVDSGPTGSDHRLEVSVIDNNSPTKIDAPLCGDSVNDRGEIRFPAGQFSTTIEQAVIRGERDLYTFDAAAGQPLELFLPSVEDNAVFDLRAPSGELLIDEVSDFRIPLPEDGTYSVCVGSIRGNASYTLEIEIG